MKKPQKHLRNPKKSQTSSKFVVEGLSAVNEYLRFKPQVIERIVGKKDQVEQLVSAKKTPVISLLEDLKAKGSDVQSLPSSAPIWAEVAVTGKTENELKDRLKKKSPKVILAIDHISDPRNLGAIARSAAFFGVDTIVVPKDRQVLLTQASVATSQGAFALCDLFVVTNLSRSLAALKELDYWVIGTTVDGEDMKDVQGFYDKIVVVLGSEGSGIGRLVKKQCDRLITIQRPHGPSLESLNVSVAAGIFLNSFVNS